MPAAEPDQEERLRSALWYAVGQFIEKQCVDLNTNTTPQFIAALTELLRTQIVSVAKDLETFSKHAGRATVTTDDVLLLARRNEGLEELLRGFVEDLRAEKGITTGGARTKGKGRAKTR